MIRAHAIKRTNEVEAWKTCEGEAIKGGPFEPVPGKLNGKMHTYIHKNGEVAEDEPNNDEIDENE